MRFGEIETPGGYRMDEVASALQKSIRRGLERESLFWATELDMAGSGNYCWKRLRLIASEDVGLADSDVAVRVRLLYENWVEARKGRIGAGEIDPHARLFLVHAVLVLVRAPKSRIVDHALMAFYEGRRPELEMPDWALDRHTNRGRRMGRGQQHFFEEGALLSAEAIDDPYKEEGRGARELATQPPAERRGPGRGQLELGEA